VWALGRRSKDPLADPKAARIVFAFAAVSYFFWLKLFAIYRYILQLEMIAPLIIALAIGKLVSLNVLEYSAWLVVPTIFGTWFGSKICPRVNPVLFRTLSLAVVIIAGILSILSGLKVFG